VVLDRLGKVPQRLVRVPQIPVRLALPRPVDHLLGNIQALRVVLVRIGKVPQRMVCVSEHAVDRTRQARKHPPHTHETRTSGASSRAKMIAFDDTRKVYS